MKNRKAVVALCLFEALSLVIILVACRGNFWMFLLVLALSVLMVAATFVEAVVYVTVFTVVVVLPFRLLSRLFGWGRNQNHQKKRGNRKAKCSEASWLPNTETLRIHGEVALPPSPLSPVAQFAGAVRHIPWRRARCYTERRFPWTVCSADCGAA